MSNVFTLDSLREEVEKEFAPLQIGLSDGSFATLKSVIRLNKKTRDQVFECLDSMKNMGDLEGDDVDTEELQQLIDTVSKILELVSPEGKKLVKEIDGDLNLTMKILETWLAATQPGEAGNSPA